MRFVGNEQPRGRLDVSLVLMDWGCRESFHILDYLAEQTADRSRFEIIWLEFYGPSPRLCARIDAARAAGKRPGVDVYAAMEMDAGLCYHKHLMMNLGIVLARGKVVCFTDSDALVRPTFVESIIGAFAEDDDIVLHMDEARNSDPSFYPFARPAFDDITGFGSMNWLNGRPTGLLDKTDPLHSPNYGACMAATRRNLIAAGGADMHIDYLGHIAGPYEMTWRLVNAGKREVWHDSEWLYHVWHPGQAGDRNLAGPHDGMHVSLRALEARDTGRTEPFAPHPAIAMLRDAPETPVSELLAALVDPRWRQDWRYDRLAGAERTYRLGAGQVRLTEHGDDNHPAADRIAAPKPVFGHAFKRRDRLRHLPLLAGIVWRQLRVKRRAAGWSRPRPGSSPAREWGRKIRATVGFLRRILAFDEWQFRQCWWALAYAAQEGRRQVVLYGQGDAARILCALSRHLPVSVTGICPAGRSGRGRLFGRPAIAPEQLAGNGMPVVVAAFVDIPAYVARLEELGLSRDKIITLQ